MIGGWQVEKRTKRVLTTEHSISHIVQSEYRRSALKPRTRSLLKENFSASSVINLLLVHGVSRVADVRTIPRSRHNSQFNADFLLHDR
jgi:hypothetical protein